MLKYICFITSLLVVVGCSNDSDDEIYCNKETYNSTISNEEFERINEQLVSLFGTNTVITRSKPVPVSVPTGISIHHDPDLEKKAKVLFSSYVSEGNRIVNICLDEFHNYTYWYKLKQYAISAKDLQIYRNLSDVQKAYIGYFVSYYNFQNTSDKSQFSYNTNVPVGLIYQACDVLDPSIYPEIDKYQLPDHTPNGKDSNSGIKTLIGIVNSFTFSSGVETKCYCDLAYSVNEFNRLLNEGGFRNSKKSQQLSIRR